MDCFIKEGATDDKQGESQRLAIGSSRERGGYALSEADLARLQPCHDRPRSSHESHVHTSMLNVATTDGNETRKHDRLKVRAQLKEQGTADGKGRCD